MKQKLAWDGWSYGIPTVEDIKNEILNLNKIKPPEFVERKIIDNEDIASLADNIKRVGLIQPLVVKQVKDRYEIIAGHRRYKALKVLGAVSVQCIIKNLGRLEADYVKLSENIYRTDLTDIEEAESIAHLMKIGKRNTKQVAKDIGKSLSYVDQKLAILKYPENLREALQNQLIVFSVARELIRLKNDNMRNEYLKHAIKGGATPALVKEWVDDIIRAEKRVVEDDGAQRSAAMHKQTPEPTYFCMVCGGKATLQDSQLYRIHTKEANEIMEGGE